MSNPCLPNEESSAKDALRIRAKNEGFAKEIHIRSWNAHVLVHLLLRQVEVPNARFLESLVTFHRLTLLT